MIAVRMVPASTPRIGLENFVNILVNSGTSARGATDELIVFMPNIRIEKPHIIVPTVFFLSLLENNSMNTPITARIGEKEEGFSILIKKLELSIPVRLKIHEVIVVPTFAPMMITTAWDNFIMPELTNPTAMTVVAEDD